MTVIFAYKLPRRSVVFVKELNINSLQTYLLVNTYGVVYRIVNVIGLLSRRVSSLTVFGNYIRKKG